MWKDLIICGWNIKKTMVLVCKHVQYGQYTEEDEMRKVKCAMMLICGICFVGCSMIPSKIAGRSLELDENDAGKEIQVAVGDQITINLEGNLTTGYAWSIVQIDEGMLEQQGEVQYERESDLIGAGEITTFTFKALDAGQTQLELEYKRPFEKDKAPLRTFLIKIVVQ